MDREHTNGLKAVVLISFDELSNSAKEETATSPLHTYAFVLFEGKLDQCFPFHIFTETVGGRRKRDGERMKMRDEGPALLIV